MRIGARAAYLTLGLVTAAGFGVVQGYKPAAGVKQRAQLVQSAKGHRAAQGAEIARVEREYGSLPLMFEENRGQTDGTARFLSRHGGYVVYVTPAGAVFKLPMRAVFKPGAVLPKPEDTAKGETAEAWVDHDSKGGRPAWAGKDDKLVRKGPGRPPWAGSDTEFENMPIERTAALHMRFVGSEPNPGAVGLDRKPAVVNYYRGADPSKWHTAVPTYERVKLNGVYPGIDVVYYGRQRQLEYDMLVAPGADPARIELAFDGADTVALAKNGDLILELEDQHLVQHKPVSYQEIDGERRPVTSQYVMKGESAVGIELGAYDKTQPLVIDPSFVYSTFVGGSGHDQGNGISVDSAGRAVVVGKTSSADFPTKNAKQGDIKDNVPNEDTHNDVFVTKLNASGSDILWSTYLGGTFDDKATGVDLDASGGVHVSGWTASGILGMGDPFPTTANAFQRIINGSTDDCIDITPENNGPHDQPHPIGCFDAFYSKLTANGVLVYSTMFGGASEDRGMGIGVSGSGLAYLVGFTQSTNMPVTSTAFQKKLVDPDEGQQQIDPPPDAFVAAFDASKSGAASRRWSTYLGGNAVDRAYGAAVDGSGNVYLTGSTSSRARDFYPGFPTTLGAYDRVFNTAEPDEGPNPNDAQTGCCDVGSDVFVTKFNSSGKIVFSTLLGARDGDPGDTESVNDGERFDIGRAIAVDAAGNAVVTGIWGGCGGSSCDPPVDSKLFPTTDNAYSRAYGGGEGDVFVTRFNSTGSRITYSTYFGGMGEDVGWGIDVVGSNIYVVGTTDPTGVTNDSEANAEATNFPQKNSLLKSEAAPADPENEDAFLLKFNTTRSGKASLAYATLIRGTNHGPSETCFTSADSSTDTPHGEVPCSTPGSHTHDQSGGEDTGRAIDAAGSNAYVTGGTKNPDFPTTAGAFDRTHNGGFEDTWVAKIKD